MRILQRVEEIRAEEHTRLRWALRRANQAMESLGDEQAKIASGEGRAVDMFGDPIVGRTIKPDEVEESAPKVVDLGPLQAVWRPFESRLLERVDTWEMDLWPLVRRWVMGEPVAQAVQTVASGMLARRTKLEPLLRDVRMQVSFVGAMRAPVMAVFSALEACDSAEAEVVPALISGKVDHAERTLEGAQPRMLSSAQVAQNLRSQTRVPRRPPQGESDRSGLFGKLGRFMGWKGR